MSALLDASGITDADIDADALTQAVTDARAGAVVTFAGVVRNHDLGQAVDSIEYSSHPQAPAIIAEIAAEFTGREGVRAISLVHRVGHLAIGDLAMVAVVAAEHRGQAFSATSDLVDEVKKRLPVWKHQHFSDGHSEWTGLP